MYRTHRRRLAALAVTSAAAMTGLGISTAAAATPHTVAPAAVVEHGYVGSAHALGALELNHMTVTVALQPQHQAQLQAELAGLYNPQSPTYHHWLAPGQFAAEFAPTAAQRSAVLGYLHQAGLKARMTGPLLVTATGSSAQVDAAFHTTIERYQQGGRSFHTISRSATVPASLRGVVQGVLGLTTTHPLKSQYRVMPKNDNGRKAQYGAGPDGSGQTPSQTVGLNNGARIRDKGVKGEGNGVTMAVFELSGYTPSDITTWFKQFYGSMKMPAIRNIAVDGGPINPQCPAGDMCGPTYTGNGSADYSGDIEVEADIEMEMAMDPAAGQIEVYNAPNDVTGQTEVDEYTTIASQDTAPVISSSWGECEYDATGDSSPPDLGFVDAEETAFEQMATQGQSLFSAAGDTGAFDCLRGSGNPMLNVMDPSSDPYVTGVGGTSWGTYDPGNNQNPQFPVGHQTVWNPLDLCSPNSDSTSGYCASFGAGGGGDSSLWTAPKWQTEVPGVANSYSSYTCGADENQLCREVPDISAVADEFTPYSEYCTGSASTIPLGQPGASTCETITQEEGYPTWFGIGGTSLAAPLWAGVFGEAVGLNGQSLGLAASDLDHLYVATDNSGKYLIDVNGIHQVENNNGYYPDVAGYDQATGLGSPDIDTLVPVLK